jgi:hypothetical protein
MANIDLLFQGRSFPIPRKSIPEFLTRRSDLSTAPSYIVQSPVPARIFQEFVDSLRAGTQTRLSHANAVFILLLANEFSFADLRSDCAAFALQATSELSNRLTRLEEQLIVHERQLESLTARLNRSEMPISRLQCQTDAHERQIEGLLSKLPALETRQAQTENGLQQLKSSTRAQVQNIESSVTELKGRMTTTEGLFQGITVELENLRGEIEGLARPNPPETGGGEPDEVQKLLSRVDDPVCAVAGRPLSCYAPDLDYI